ncbi:MAG: protein translocase subunit SecD [Clostridia bacterium]|nr:protein translocase subunit SecD [Clostridia bacterium]
MNYTKATSIARFTLLVLVIVALMTFAIGGVYITDDLQMQGIFEEGMIRLGLDLAGGSSITYQAENDGKEITQSGMDSVLEVMRNRLDNAGYTEALAYLYGDDMLVIELPSVDDPTSEALNFMQTAKLEFIIEGEKKAVLTGEDVESAVAGWRQDEKSGEVVYCVNLEFNAAGEKKFADATKTCAANNKTLGIYVDGQLISAPSVDSSYKNTGITGGKAEISGSFTSFEEAEALAFNIDAGALQYNLKQVSMESVNATLGEDALRISLIAGGIGLLLVMIFMCVYYRVSGAWASIALVGYTAIFFLVLIIGQFNLTLTGIAGIVLSIGMAVDANVVIFERMKEELGAGKTVKGAINSGYKRALWAILDSNITTLIACFVLYFFGTGTIKGFATTLGIGVVISLFTALVVTRVLLNLGVGMGLTNIKAYKSGFGGKTNA